MDDFESFLRADEERKRSGALTAPPPAQAPAALAPAPTAPVAAPADPFEAFLRKAKGEDMMRAQATSVANSQQSTATAASAAPVARELGMPQGAVETDVPRFQQQARAQRNAGVLSSNPVLAAWVAANPDSARVAQDEFDKLSNVEKLWEGGKDWGYAALQGLGGGFNQASLALNRIGGATSMLLGSRSANDWFMQAARSDEERQKALTLDPNAGLGEKTFAALGNFLSLMSQVVLTGGGAGAGVPASAGVAQTIGHAATTAGRSMAFPALTTAVNRGQEVYEKTGSAIEANKASVLSYLFTTAQGAVPFSAPGSVLQRVGTGAVSGAVTGEAERGANNLLLSPELHREFNPEEALFQAFTGALLGGVMGPRVEPNLFRAARQTYTEALRAERSQDAIDRVQQLGEMVKDSGLKKADPPALRDFIEKVTDGSDLEAVYVDPKTLRDALMQSDVPELRAHLNDASTGADVRIPVADYAVHISGTPLEAALLPHLKAEADGMTYAEGQKHFTGAQELMKATVAKAAQAQTETVRAQAESDKVYADVLSQLDALKRFTPDVNKAYAALTRDFFATLSARTGESPTALFERYRLTTAAESPTGALGQAPLGDRTNPKTRALVALRKRASILESLAECMK